MAEEAEVEVNEDDMLISESSDNSGGAWLPPLVWPPEESNIEHQEEVVEHRDADSE